MPETVAPSHFPLAVLLWPHRADRSSGLLRGVTLNGLTKKADILAVLPKLKEKKELKKGLLGITPRVAIMSLYAIGSPVCSARERTSRCRRSW